MHLLEKYRSFKRKNGNTTLSNVLRIIISLLLARLYLRKCTKIGKWVSVMGRPLIKNKGKIILEDDVRIWSSIVRTKLFIGSKGKLIVGKNSRLNGVHISAQVEVIIGRNVRIAPYSIILDSDFHNLMDHFAEGVEKRVLIEDDVWIATRCTILKGVMIGKGSVVAAGSVVTRNVPSDSLVGGIPARVIRKLK